MRDHRGLRKVRIVFEREYLATIRTRAFLVALVALPLSFGLAILVPALMHLQREIRDQSCVVVDETGGEVAESLESAALAESAAGGRLGRIHVTRHRGAYDASVARSLSERVRSRELSAFVVVGASAFELGSRRVVVRYHAGGAASGRLDQWLESQLARAIERGRLRRAGLDPAAVESARPRVELSPLSLSEAGPVDGAPRSRSERTLLSAAMPTVAALLMFMAVMLGAAPLMQSVLEEKTQRIAEILVSSVAPFQLMLGKLLGASAVSFLLLVLYFGGAYAIFGLVDRLSWFTWQNVAWLLSFQAVALLMYGSVFLAIGSLCSDLRESQTLMAPAVILCTTPLLMLPVVVAEPSGSAATWLSFVPFFTPVLMMLRATLEPGVATWQALLGLSTSLLTALACVALSSRFLQVGLISRGPAPKLGELWRWLRQD